MQKSLYNFNLLFSRLGIALLLFTLSRILFFVFNYTYFPQAGFGEFLTGLRFDLSAISYLYSPFILLHIFGFNLHKKPIYQKGVKWLFYITTALSIAFNCIDFEYYKFTLKRSTSDLMSLMSESSTDLPSLIIPFAKDYWYVILSFAGLMWLTGLLYRKTEKGNPFPTLNLKVQLPAIVLVACLWVIGMRGGFQHKPITIINAGEGIKAQNIPLVLNTPFTFLKTIFEPGVEKQEFFVDPSQYYSPVIKLEPSEKFRNKNVVLIIMESFSAEYIGAMNEGDQGYTPFLDSLIGEGLLYPNTFANGKKSIESLPAILSGIPALMNTPYIISPYAGNKIGSIATALKSKGYNTSFYHGGANGTMGFSGFAKIAGIEQYKGKNEYPNNGDYDGTWGVYDEPYFQYFAEELNQKKQPFFSTFFSLSSHHPYSIPKKYKDHFPEGKHPIHQSIAYADHSLKRFFETASQTKWFSNTLFVITADHTAKAYQPYYKNRVGMFNVPLLFYEPGSAIKGRNPKVTQHTDIYPSILHKLNYKGKVLAFGQSCFSEQTGFSVNYLNEIYQLTQGDHTLLFDGEKTVGLYNFREDLMLKKNLSGSESKLKVKMENKLKAIIQTYEERLINNNLKASE